jgi:hypothetical protein
VDYGMDIVNFAIDSVVDLRIDKWIWIFGERRERIDL